MNMFTIHTMNVSLKSTPAKCPNNIYKEGKVKVVYNLAVHA